MYRCITESQILDLQQTLSMNFQHNTAIGSRIRRVHLQLHAINHLFVKIYNKKRPHIYKRRRGIALNGATRDLKHVKMTLTSFVGVTDLR